VQLLIANSIPVSTRPFYAQLSSSALYPQTSSVYVPAVTLRFLKAGVSVPGPLPCRAFFLAIRERLFCQILKQAVKLMYIDTLRVHGDTYTGTDTEHESQPDR